MKNYRIKALYAGLSLALLGVFLWGCSDQSENIPTSWESIQYLVDQGWQAYATGDFTTASQRFQEANQRNAFYLPAYNGLGWSAVRMANFAEAEVQFSFVTTLADPATEADLLADTYAGLALSAAIERSALEISGEGDAEQLRALAQQSIDRAQMVFDLLGEAYDPAEHDPAFGSPGLHLLNAQNYFYLQEFEASEEQLSLVDPAFVPAQLTAYGTAVEGEIIPLQMTMAEQDTSWYLAPAHLGIHNYTQIIAPDTVIVPPDTFLVVIDYYAVQYADNQILVAPASGSVLVEDLEFTVSYIYIDNFVEYLYKLIEHIEELIEF